jgi:hypothetical protein
MTDYGQEQVKEVTVHLGRSLPGYCGKRRDCKGIWYSLN